MNQIKQLITQIAMAHEIDPFVLDAIVATESSYNAMVIRYETNYEYLYKVKDIAHMLKTTLPTVTTMQKVSWGLCQIMGSCAYELGLKDWATVLLSPEINLNYACLHLNKIIRSQKLTTPKDIYAAYNAGSVRYLESGKLVNQGNVDRFLKNYKLYE